MSSNQNDEELKMKKIVIESPYSGNRKINDLYLQNVIRHCLLVEGVAVYASHDAYTRALDDEIPEERRIGMEAGFEIGDLMDETWVFDDLGISGGMQTGIAKAMKSKRPVVYKKLPMWNQILRNSGLG